MDHTILKPMTTSSNQGAKLKQAFDRYELSELIEPYLIYDDKKNSALVLISVHHTRQISAHHGMEACQEILDILIKQLKGFVKENCLLIRTGKHEFALLLQNLNNPGHCQLALNRLERDLNNKTLSVKSYTTKTRMTISGALYPRHAITAESLIQSSEIAQHQAESTGVSHLMFTQVMSNRIEKQLKVETELDLAIQRKSLEVWYQPKIDLRTQKLYGVEALCRWKSNHDGFVSPEIFIPIAENSLMIKELTEWVTNTSLRNLMEWHKLGLGINMAINMSGIVVDNEEFVEFIEHSCGVWGIKPKYVTIEVTETAMMQSFETNLDKLNHLKDRGFTISMDDFGTGYSSLEYFKSLPVNEVKIDKSFVINMMDNEDDRKMVSMIAGLSRGFGLKIVAEGVENEGSLQALKELGVHRAQGYHIAKPMPEDEFLTWADFYLTNLDL